MERVVIFSLTNDAQDLLLKLALPPIITFLAGWVIIRVWANRQGAGATGFSPAVAAAFFTPAIFVTYLLFPPKLVTLSGSVSFFIVVVMPALCGLVFPPTFFLLLPFGIKSLVRVQQRMQPFSDRLLFIVFVAWMILQAGWLLFLFGYVLQDLE